MKSRTVALYARALLIAVIYSGVVAAQAQPQSTAPVALAIQTELEALLSPDASMLREATIAFPERLHAFYAQRSFQPAWPDPTTASELLRALEDSEADGLTPSDYHAPLLRPLAAQAASPTASARVRAQHDILLTEGLLRLAYHLSFGKVDPASFDSQWNYGRTLADADVSQRLAQAAGAADIYSRVQGLRPTHPLYTRLLEALASHRAMERNGGWPQVPPGDKLEPRAIDPRVPVLRARLIAGGDLPASAASDSAEYDGPLEAAVKAYQQRVGLAADGVVGARTVAELNVPLAERIAQLRVNLDRGRVLLHDLPPEFAAVNIAGFTVHIFRDGESVWTARAQVGRPYRRTPIFRSEISYLVWNPTWTVPPSIIANDILPDARRDPGSITRRGLKVLDRNGQELDPASVDWSRYKSGHIPFTLRQDPGPKNALGRVKFMFPNPYHVYLHDTPSQTLFDRPERAFSSGCVRIEHAFEFAEQLLKDPQRWNQDSIAGVLATNAQQHVKLPRKIPVLLTYWTAWAEARGPVQFRRDVYQQDPLWLAGLSAAFRVQPTARITP